MRYSVIPQPKKLSVKSETIVFTLTASAGITCPEGLERAHDDLAQFLLKNFEIEPDGMGRETISFEIKPGCTKSEGYILKVDYDNIFITAADSAGAFYAVQTLKQLLLQGELSLPEMEIIDEPEYVWRGLMLDSARYFYPVDDVKIILDAMALHKLNRFHLHLTDDQGWRVELYEHLLLAQIGGFRAYTNFGKKPHGGFYSKNDIEEIISYAHDRFITVIPEIDSPGHVVSAIAAYPELSCFDRKLEVATHTGVKHDVLCVGKESTFEFMFSVFDEICEMFPDKIIHIGGDEVMQTRWKICPHCQKLMKEKGFKSESELYTYYINRIASHIRSKGYDVIMWNSGENESELSGDIMSQYWNANPNTDELNQSGRKMINSNSNAYYFDLPYGKISLKECYEYEALPKGLDRNLMLGVEGCLWTEYIPDMEKVGLALFPRVAALSESAWTPEEKKSYENFLQKLPAYFKLIKTTGMTFAKPRQYAPSFVRKQMQNLLFERRRLHWQGLHNIIDNKKVEKAAQKRKGMTK